MRICNQLFFVVLYYISSRLVSLLEVINASIQVPNVIDLTVSFKFLNFSFQIYLHFVLKCLLALHLTLFRLPILLRLGSFINCILACFLWTKKSKHSLWNHGFCCFHSCSPRFSLVEILIFSLMFSQALLTFSSPFKFSKAAKLFLISIWYFFLTPSSFSFLRLSQTTVQVVYIQLIFPLILGPPDSDQYHNQLPWNFVHLVC